ncbi:MAG: hypothetical protein HQ582_33565 [Planctomycetes bacterium]|nr:hypothetical protein [Planctomycetota bacterium]
MKAIGWAFVLFGGICVLFTGMVATFPGDVLSNLIAAAVVFFLFAVPAVGLGVVLVRRAAQRGTIGVRRETGGLSLTKFGCLWLFVLVALLPPFAIWLDRDKPWQEERESTVERYQREKRQTQIAEIMNNADSYKTFAPNVRAVGKFSPPFFPVYEDRDLNGELTFYYDYRYIADAVEQARTIVFVKTDQEEAGDYVTPVLKEKKFKAISWSVTICLVDVANPLRRHVITANSTPAERIVNNVPQGGAWALDGEKQKGGSQGPGMLLQKMLEHVREE